MWILKRKEKKVNDNIVLDVFIICHKLRHVQVILKIPYTYLLIDLQSNPPKRPDRRKTTKGLKERKQLVSGTTVEK